LNSILLPVEAMRRWHALPAAVTARLESALLWRGRYIISHAAEGARMSIRSGLRKFRPGASAPVRHLWRAFLVIALIGVLGIVLWLML
jgi:hypothetical protein